MPINVGSAIATLTLDNAPFMNGLRAANAALGTFGKDTATAGQKLTALGSALSSAGKTLTMGVTVPLLTAGTTCVAFASQFETGVAKINTLDPSAPAAKIEKISSDILKLSNETGISADSLAESTYAMGSALGTLGDDVVDYVEVANKAAIGGFTDTATAVDGLSTAMNAYGLTGVENMRKISDEMLIAQNLGKTTFGEMAHSMGQVIPLTATLGVSTSELFAATAALTKQGIGTSEAMTGLKAAFSNILKPSSEAAKKAKKLGIDFSAAALESKGLAGFLAEVSEKCGGDTEAMAALFGSTEALNTILALTSEDGGAAFVEALAAMENSAGATDAAFEMMQSTNQVAWQKLKNSIQIIATQMGSLMLPALQQMAQKIQSLLDWIVGLDDGTRQMILTIAGVAAAIGPVLLIIGKLIGSVKAIGSAISMLSSPVGLIIAGIAALAAGFIYLWNNCEGFRAGVTAAWNAIVKAMQPVIKAFKELKTKAQAALEPVMEKLGELWDKVKELGSKLWPLLEPIVKVLGAGLGGVVASLYGAINGLIEALDPMVDAVSSAIDVIMGVVDAVIALLKGDFAGAFSSLSGVFESFKTMVANMFDSVWTFMSGWWEGVKSFFSGFGIDLQGALQGVWDWIVNAFSGVGDWFASLSWSLPTIELPDWVENVLGVIKGWWESAVTWFQGWAWGFPTLTLPNWLSSAADSVKTLIGNAWTWLSGMFQGWAWGFPTLTLPEWLSDAAESVKTLINSAWTTMAGWFQGWNWKFPTLTVPEWLQTVYEAIKEKVDWFKGCFNWTWSFPKIKYPVISVSWDDTGWGFSVPKISIGWRTAGGGGSTNGSGAGRSSSGRSGAGRIAKVSMPEGGNDMPLPGSISAVPHAKGGIFDAPTLLPGIRSMHLVAEAGAEAILPLDLLWSKLDEKLDTAMGGGKSGTVINQKISIHSPKPMDEYEAARQIQKVNRELAMEWR